MKNCVKCGKVLDELFITAYGDAYCLNCLNDYLTTDKGKVEYLIGIVSGNYLLSDYDEHFLSWVATCWNKYRKELALSIKDIIRIEVRARELGLL